jgi:hypothetical protein
VGRAREHPLLVLCKTGIHLYGMHVLTRRLMHTPATAENKARSLHRKNEVSEYVYVRICVYICVYMCVYMCIYMSVHMCVVLVELCSM